MKVRSPVTLVLGALLFAFGAYLLVRFAHFGGAVPLVIGASLVWLGWRGGRVATLVFGHATVVVGCVLVTWGFYLLPYSKPTAAHVFGRPLFWGMFAIGGGVCAIYHGFCRCVGRPRKDGPPPCTSST